MAAKIVSSSINSDGSFTVTYDNGTIKVLTAAQAQQAGALPDTAGGYGSNGPATFGVVAPQTVVDPATGTAAPTSGVIPWRNPKTGKMEFTDIGKQIAAARVPNQYAYIRSQLVASGLLAKGSKSQTSTQNAWLQVLIGAQTAQMDPFEYMKQMKASGVGIDTGASSGPQTNISLKTYSTNQVQSIAEQVYLNTVGRKPSSKELTDLTNQLNAKEKAAPTKTVSTPNAAGTVTTSKTSGGLDEQQFIQSQVESSAALKPEVSRMKDINFSSWLDKAMSGGPGAGGLPNG